MTYEELEAEMLQLLNTGDWDSAQKILFEEQEKGNPDVFAIFGELFYEGALGYEKDILKAKELYEKSFQSGSARGAYMLGRFYDYGNELFAEEQIKAQYYYETAARKGDRDAVYMLATRYGEGKFVDTSPEKAFELYAKGADMGNPGCMENLAVLYEFGEGTKQDIKTAIYWYRRTLEYEPDNDFCMWRLACCLTNIFNYTSYAPSPKDIEEAYELTCKAIDLGNTEAYFILAWFYEEGNIVPRDYDMAQKYMKLGADNGCELAIENLGRYKRDIFGHYYV